MAEDKRMTTTNSTSFDSERMFRRLDAGQQREYLATQLLEWRDAGMMSFMWRNTWLRRVAILAKRTGQSRAQVITALGEDADAMEAAR